MTTETSAIRTIDGKDYPVAGTWVIDPAHTSIEFVARHMMVTKVRGSFRDFDGTVEVGEDPTATAVSVDVRLASVDTGSPDRDGHLRSGDFFDIESHPTMTFRSTGVARHGDDWKLSGDLTILGVRRPVTLDVEYFGVVTDPWGKPKAQFSATGEVERADWNLTWNVPLEKGGVLVSKRAKLEIEAQLSYRG